MVHGTRAGPKQCFPRMPVTGASLLKETVCIQDSRLMLYFLCFTACTVKTARSKAFLKWQKSHMSACGVLSSAVSMDKAYTKLLVDDLGIRQADYVLIRHTDLTDMEACAARVEAKLKYPVFVKPSKAGSSCGVSKAEDRSTLIEALKEAVKHDIRILVEETIVGREVECAVLGGYAPKASNVGEVLSAEDFLYI